MIEDGSPNVFLGGGTQTVLEISPEIPDWLRQVVDVLYVVAGMLGGLAGAWRQAAKMGSKFGTKCAAKFIGGEMVGMAISDTVMGLFSNPVDVTTGQKILLPETDFTLPGRLPVTCSRFYASHLETEGLLGRGWRLNWEINLREDETYITFIGVQGRELSYPKEMLIPGHQIFDPEEQFYLSRLHDGCYVLHYTDCSYYVFDEFDDHGVAPLLFMETPYRQRIAFGRENGRLVRVASSSGHHLLLHRTMTQAGERLSHIELLKGGRPGNLVEYRYDDNGQLTGVVNRAGVTVRQFAYENGLMTEHRNATGFTCTYHWEEIEGFPRVVEHTTSDGEDYRFHYDFAGGQTVVTGRPEQKWQWWFDEETYVTAHRTPGGGMYRFTYNENHFPVAVELPGERRVTLEYDTLSRVVKETDPAGRVTQTQWNGSFAEITRRALDDDHVWKADYNEHGQVIRETDPEGRVTRYGYDDQGLPETVCHPGKQQDRYTWNALGLLSSHRRITGSVQSWQYTQRGMLARHTDEEKRETRWQYTPEGLVASLSNGNGAQYRFSYDGDGRLTGEQRPDGLIRMFALNADGFPVIIPTQGTEGGVRNEQQERDALGRLLRSDTQHSTRTFSYNRLDQITEVTLTPTEEGERLHHMQADTVRFAYDRSGWLTSRTGQMYDHDHYYYDKAGNLLTDEYQGAVMDNRLPGYGRDRYRYNEWGELTERRDQQLEWNAQGQLTRVISSNSETRYQYDALGRRISKATSNLHTDRGERSRTTFVWEGFRLLQETTWQGKRTYLYDAEQPYTPVAAITGRGESQKIWYYHTDLTGTVHEVTAPDGTLVWAGYQAGFGENRGDISNSGAYFEQPQRLPGQYFDEETGLHYNLFRYYAPECGRFVSQDPIGLNGGLNLYAYAPNPLGWIDPLGLNSLGIDSNNIFRGDGNYKGGGIGQPKSGTISAQDIIDHL